LPASITGFSKEKHAKRIFKEVGEAYEVLKNRTSAPPTIASVKQTRSGEQYPAARMGRGFRIRRRRPVPRADYSEFFESLFGSARAADRARNGAAQAQDHHAKYCGLGRLLEGGSPLSRCVCPRSTNPGTYSPKNAAHVNSERILSGQQFVSPAKGAHTQGPPRPYLEVEFVSPYFMSMAGLE